ncbi:MAG: hypothetical protein KA297_06110 [Kofleriaceae bacterium]|jgi:hypothetical protein|nr:hypothetical protein [Kofleriaceae bacterium]MBP6841516.1 hypothetical protein [Kofleriaceae bacterium]
MRDQVASATVSPAAAERAPRSGGGAGIAALEAAGDAAPADLAALLDDFPGQRTAMLGWLQAHRGNAVVARVLEAERRELRAEARGDQPLTAEQQRQMWEAQTTIHGTADESDRAVVLAELVRLPEGVVREVVRSGLRIKVCRNDITEIEPSLASRRPRGWAEGETFAGVPGAYHPPSRSVLVAVQGGRFAPGHGSAHLLFHELAHGLDASTGASRSRAFRAAYQADQAGLPAYEQQAGNAGRSEAYAESFARTYGGAPGAMAGSPALAGYWRDDEMTQAAGRSGR